MSRIDVLVTGVPGAGKTTLARALSRHPELPMLSLDRVKEALNAELHSLDRTELRKAAQAVLWDLLADAHMGAVVDLWLDPERDAGVLSAGLSRTGLHTAVEVLCHVPPDVAVLRYTNRVRAGPHLPPDPATLARVRRAAEIITLHGIGPGRLVDTMTPVDVAELAEWIRAIDL